MAKDDDIHDTTSKRYKAMKERHAAERERRAKVKAKKPAKPSKAKKPAKPSKAKKRK